MILYKSGSTFVDKWSRWRQTWPLPCGHWCVTLFYRKEKIWIPTGCHPFSRLLCIWVTNQNCACGLCNWVHLVVLCNWAHVLCAIASPKRCSSSQLHRTTTGTHAQLLLLPLWLIVVLMRLLIPNLFFFFPLFPCSSAETGAPYLVDSVKEDGEHLLIGEVTD